MRHGVARASARDHDAAANYHGVFGLDNRPSGGPISDKSALRERGARQTGGTSQ